MIDTQAAPGGKERVRRMRARIVVGAIIVASVLVLVAANAHLVYVAFTTQPDCVPHLKEAGKTPGAYRAARSAC